MIWKLEFWKAATERAVKTGAQTVLSAFFTLDVAFNVLEADWANMGGIAAGGVLFSYLTSMASGFKDGNPSAGSVERVATSYRPKHSK